tara:strand:+ start:217 stop:651 length:435 start_codon:yes stop_codon:yes gene_type:complete
VVEQDKIQALKVVEILHLFLQLKEVMVDHKVQVHQVVDQAAEDLWLQEVNHLEQQGVVQVVQVEDLFLQLGVHQVLLVVHLNFMLVVAEVVQVNLEEAAHHRVVSVVEEQVLLGHLMEQQEQLTLVVAVVEAVKVEMVPLEDQE